MQYTLWLVSINFNNMAVMQFHQRASITTLFIQGEPFRIINITAQNKQAVINECEKFLKLKLF